MKDTGLFIIKAVVVFVFSLILVKNINIKHEHDIKMEENSVNLNFGAKYGSPIKVDIDLGTKPYSPLKIEHRNGY